MWIPAKRLEFDHVILAGSGLSAENEGSAIVTSGVRQQIAYHLSSALACNRRGRYRHDQTGGPAPRTTISSTTKPHSVSSRMMRLEL